MLSCGGAGGDTECDTVSDADTSFAFFDADLVSLGFRAALIPPQFYVLQEMFLG